MDHTVGADHTQAPGRTSRKSSPDPATYPATLLVGTDDGAAALLRAETGATIWRASARREVGTLAQDGAQFYVAFGSLLRLVRPHSRRRESPERRRRRFARLQAEPARLEARSARDGRLLWRRADWELIGHLNVGAEPGGEVVAVGSTSIYGDHALYGLDARTGATRWTYPATSQAQINGHRFAMRGGRIYCYGGGKGDGEVVLDARTGQPIWSRDGLPGLVLSPRGQVVVELRPGLGMETTVRVLDPAAGAVRQEFAVEGGVRVVTDAGVAYLSTGGYENPGLAAVRLEDGRELWRVDDVLTYQLAATETTVYCAHLLESTGVGEVEALDADSGRRRWRWRTPGDTRELLRLWGARTPWIMAASAALAGKALYDALAQPSPRDVGNALWRELADGQWRRPYGLHGAVNAMWLVADKEAAYLGTRLGVFALRADDGRLLWHALPTTDLSFVGPALSR